MFQSNFQILWSYACTGSQFCISIIVFWIASKIFVELCPWLIYARETNLYIMEKPVNLVQFLSMGIVSSNKFSFIVLKFFQTC